MLLQRPSAVPQTQHPPTQFPRLLSSSSPGSFDPRMPYRSLPVGAGNRGRLLTRVSTWRVRTGLSVSDPASARHSAPLSSRSSRQNGGREGRRVMTGRDRAPAPERLLRRWRLGQRTLGAQARLDWTGRGGAGREEQAPPSAALPPPCPHLLVGGGRGEPSLPLRSGGRADSEGSVG